MENRFEDVTHVKISELLPTELVRLASNKDCKHAGVTEIFLSFDLREPFAKSLSFPVPWDREVHGFLRNKQELYRKIGLDTIVRITIIDWNDKFVLVFEDKEGTQNPIYSTHRDCVKTLLEECMRPEIL